ncbi:MAG: hypothetical protein ACREMA_18900 [Longimicrobiales bacterium]
MKPPKAVPVLSLFVALAGMAGSVAAQAPEKAINPVGDFEYTTTVDGQPISGVISIVRKDNALTGKILSEAMPEIPITNVTVEARKVTIKATIPDGELTIVLNFEDDNKFAGNWSLADQGGAISGKRKTS